MLSDLPPTPKAAKAAGVVHYYTGRLCKRGHDSKRFASTAQCVACQSIHMTNAYATDPAKFRARSRQDYKANKSARRAQHRRWEAANPDYFAVYAWFNAEALVDRRRIWNAANRPLKRFYWAKYMMAKRHATPLWLTPEQEEQIKAFYFEAAAKTVATGVVYEVDHVVPLQGKNVCGLHVPWNLQVLTAEENCRKGNSYA